MIISLSAILLVGITLLIHGCGTIWWLRRLTRGRAAIRPGSAPGWRALQVLLATGVLFTLLHVIEIAVWAFVFLVVAPGELDSLQSAFYFSAVTFTTLGYGDIVLHSDWRVLSGIEAINGIVLIGWTTAFLFAILQHIWINNSGQSVN